MKFSVNQQDLQKSLGYCQGVIEKRSTLPILSNILIEAANSKLKITATDLDLIFVNEISNIKIFDEGKTTTSSSIMFDIVRKIPSGSHINFENTGESKLQLESNKSLFNLLFRAFSIAKKKGELLNNSTFENINSQSPLISSSEIGSL